MAAKSKWVYVLFPFLRWMLMLNRETVKADIIAGMTAGVLILPQAIALATLAGLPPEYGLYTSIFPVMFAALFGSSWHAMSGPNTALSILIAFTIAPYASIASPEWIQYAVTLAFMAGVIQVSLGLLRLGIIFNYFSQTVTVALITGVGVIIIVSQLGNFMGVLMNIAEPIEDAIPQVVYGISRANGFAVSVGIVTVISGLLIKYYFPKLPFLIIAVIAGMLFSAGLELAFGESNVGLDKLGTMSLSALPLSSPDFSPENFAEASQGLLPAAFVIAFLGLIQASLIARAMAIKSGQCVDINQEVLGQGISNMAGSFVSCFPSCSSFNRSASNFESGGRTPLSALISVITLAVLVVFAAPIIAHMPISVMAAILLLVGAGLIKKNDIKKVLLEKRENQFIFALVLFATIYGGVDYAVFFGITLSIIAYMKNVSKPEIGLLTGKEAQQYSPQLGGTLSSRNYSGKEHQKYYRYSEGKHSLFSSPKKECNELDVEVPRRFDHVTVLQISGSLFFGSVPRLESVLVDLRKQDNGEEDLIISGENLHSVDGAGAEVLVREAQNRIEKGFRMLLWLRNHNHDAVFQSSGLIKTVGEENIYYLKEYSSENL